MKTLLGLRAIGITVASLSLAAGLGACGSGSSMSSAAPTSTASTTAAQTADTGAAGGPPAGGPPGGAGGQTASASTAATELASEVKSKFKQATYKDTTTGTSLPYNVYLPEGYDPSKKYPIVLYIADSSLVGQDVTAPLSQYGALVWASKAQQAKQKAIVVVPEYPSIIIDDQSGHTKTKYVELTARFVAAMEKTYSVDTSRVYGTGQSMGAMTVMTLAAEHPDLFTAEMIVSGQWDPAQLTGLTKAKFVYTAAGGDAKAAGGQSDVEAILKKAGAAYDATTLDATASATTIQAAAEKVLSSGDQANFFTFKTGTVLTAGGQSTSSQMGAGEHMASFEPAYKISALRDWLMKQTA